MEVLEVIRGKGGFGVVILENNSIKYKYSGYSDNATNNQMELCAIIRALEYIYNNEDNEYVIYSDSSYCVNICNDWIWKWKDNNWMNSKNEEIKNKDMICYLYNLLNSEKNFVIRKCAGHSNIIGNELADAICTNNIAKFNGIISKNNIEICCN